MDILTQNPVITIIIPAPNEFILLHISHFRYLLSQTAKQKKIFNFPESDITYVAKQMTMSIRSQINLYFTLTRFFLRV